jgi:hypothetical protein
VKIRVVFAVAVAGYLVAGQVGLAGPATVQPKPKVWVVDRSPIVVAAAGFGSRERVALTLKASATTYAKSLRATRAGRVRAEWSGSIQIDGCHLVVVTAVGAHTGLRATYSSPKPKGGVECPTPIQPADQ